MTSSIPYRIVGLASSFDESGDKPTMRDVDALLRKAIGNNEAATVWAKRLDDPNPTTEAIQLHLTITNARLEIMWYEAVDQHGHTAIIWLPENPQVFVDFDLIV